MLPEHLGTMTKVHLLCHFSVWTLYKILGFTRPRRKRSWWSLSRRVTVELKNNRNRPPPHSFLTPGSCSCHQNRPKPVFNPSYYDTISSLCLLRQWQEIFFRRSEVSNWEIIHLPLPLLQDNTSNKMKNIREARKTCRGAACGQQRSSAYPPRSARACTPWSMCPHMSKWKPSPRVPLEPSGDRGSSSINRAGKAWREDGALLTFAAGDGSPAAFPQRFWDPADSQRA